MSKTHLPQLAQPTLPDLASQGRDLLRRRAARLGPETGKGIDEMAIASAYLGSVPKATERAYRLGQRRFADWCEENGVPYAFPRHAVTPEALAMFIDSLVAEGLKPATVDSYVAGVAAMHRALDIPNPADAKIVREAKRSHRRAVGTAQKQAAPMRWPSISAALAKLGTTPLDLRDAALLSVAYDTLGRASELCALNVGDVVETDETASVTIRRSKTDQEGQGSIRYLAPDSLARVRAWIEVARLEKEDPLFVPLSAKGKGERLTRRDVSRIFKARVGESLSAHSARVGAALDQRAAGMTTGEIAQAGGWKGEAMPNRYTAHLAPRDGAAAKLAQIQGRA